MEKRKSCLKADGSSSVSTATSSSPSSSSSVCFGDLTIYEFKNVLGDNPAVSEGAPLTIGWKHETMNVIAVDYYEFLRNQRPRRRRKDLVIPSTSRDTYLLGLGYKLEQIVDAAEETRRIRKNRVASMKGTPWDKFKAVFDRTNANVRRNMKTPEPRIVAAKTG